MEGHFVPGNLGLDLWVLELEPVDVLDTDVGVQRPREAPASVIEEKGRSLLFHMPMLKSSIIHYDGRLYIDAWILSDIKGIVVIDVYRASDGSYEYSFELPEKHAMSSGMTIGGRYALSASKKCNCNLSLTLY
ncbi:MAG: hypothetical protein OXL40_08985 [Bacteroidota bacterium]|nr:hypothetical protein [Bacteroidota bacterium]